MKELAEFEWPDNWLDCYCKSHIVKYGNLIRSRYTRLIMGTAAYLQDTLKKPSYIRFGHHRESVIIGVSYGNEVKYCADIIETEIIEELLCAQTLLPEYIDHIRSGSVQEGIYHSRYKEYQKFLIGNVIPYVRYYINENTRTDFIQEA